MLNSYPLPNTNIQVMKKIRGALDDGINW
jgi:hypothetical protein